MKRVLVLVHVGRYFPGALLFEGSRTHLALMKIDTHLKHTRTWSRSDFSQKYFFKMCHKMDGWVGGCQLLSHCMWSGCHLIFLMT